MARRLSRAERIALALPLLVLLRSTAGGQSPGELPDQALSPGAVRSTDLAEICVPGAASEARSVSRATHREVFRRYGITAGLSSLRRLPVVNRVPGLGQRYELDHVIPLCLGGSNVPENLYPQPRQGTWTAREKDRLEVRLCAYACQGRVGIEEAQAAIARNWVEAYHRYVEGPRPPVLAPRVIGWGEGPAVGPPPVRLPGSAPPKPKTQAKGGTK